MIDWIKNLILGEDNKFIIAVKPTQKIKNKIMLMDNCNY